LACGSAGSCEAVLGGYAKGSCERRVFSTQMYVSTLYKLSILVSVQVLINVLSAREGFSIENIVSASWILSDRASVNIVCVCVTEAVSGPYLC